MEAAAAVRGILRAFDGGGERCALRSGDAGAGGCGCGGADGSKHALALWGAGGLGRR
jgi:hypothetical protein